MNTSMRTLGVIVGETYGKISSGSNYWSNYTILGFLPAYLLTSIFLMCQIKRSVEKEIKNTQSFIQSVNDNTKTMQKGIVDQCNITIANLQAHATSCGKKSTRYQGPQSSGSGINNTQY